MDTLESTLQRLVNLASEKLKQPEAVTSLPEQVDRLLSRKFRICLVYVPGIGTRKFCAEVTAAIKAAGADVSQYSLFQAVDAFMKSDPALISMDYAVLILDRVTRLTAADQARIDTLKRVFGDEIRGLPANSERGAKNEAAELLTSIRSNYEEKHREWIEERISQIQHRVQHQRQMWLLLRDDAQDDALSQQFKEKFVPDLKKFVKFRMTEIFPQQVVNPTVRDKINSLTDQDLKMKPLDEIYSSIEESCIVTFEAEVNALCTECVNMFLTFFNENSSGQKLLFPEKWSPPEVPAIRITRPQMNFDGVGALADGIWGGVYPTAFAVISAIQTGGYAIGVPALVTAAFAIQGYRNAKSQHEKSGIETIRTELNQNATLAGNKVQYKFEQMIQEMLTEALRAFDDAQRDKAKTTIHVPDQSFLQSAEYEQALKDFESVCDELKTVIKEWTHVKK